MVFRIKYEMIECWTLGASAVLKIFFLSVERLLDKYLFGQFFPMLPAQLKLIFSNWLSKEY